METEESNTDKNTLQIVGARGDMALAEALSRHVLLRGVNVHLTEPIEPESPQAA